MTDTRGAIGLALLCGLLLSSVRSLSAQAPTGTVADTTTAPAGHKHGAAALELILDGRAGTLEFMAAASGVYGIEREPRNALEREQRARALSTLRTRIAELVILDASLGCSIIASEVHAGNDSHGHVADERRHQHGWRDDRNRTHVDVHGEYTIACAKLLANHDIRFAFTKAFPALTSVEVRVRSGGREQNHRIESDRGTVRP